LSCRAWAPRGQPDAGHSHSVEICNGKLYAWGNNGNGQLGNGTITTTMPARPVNAIFPFGVSLVSVASGAGHHLVLGSEGQICAWGGECRRRTR
jgi:alpha-tubulin suppressor-like RCC1 family protein